YKYLFVQTAVGISFCKDYYDSHEDEYRNYSNTYNNSNKGVTASFILRGNVFGLDIQSGYSQLVQIILSRYSYYSGPSTYNSGQSTTVVKTNAIHAIITGRINITRQIVNPFLL